jgi:hypothetical protein
MKTRSSKNSLSTNHALKAITWNEKESSPGTLSSSSSALAMVKYVGENKTDKHNLVLDMKRVVENKKNLDKNGDKLNLSLDMKRIKTNGILNILGIFKHKKLFSSFNK